MDIRERVSDPTDVVEAARGAAQEFILACSSDDEDWVVAAFAAVPPAVLAMALVALVNEARDAYGAAKNALNATSGIVPAGLSRGTVWEVALASDARRAGVS